MGPHAFAWVAQQTGLSSAEEEVDSPSTLFNRLVAGAPNLQSLFLTVVGYAYSVRPSYPQALKTSTKSLVRIQVPFGSRHISTDFLEPQILSTLSSMESLRCLTLGTSVDFEELEVILIGMPHLQDLTLDGGFDDVNGRGVVTSTTPHQARLRSLVIGNGQTSYRDYTSITDVQLAWLIEPATTSLETLDVTIMSTAAGGGFGGFAGIAPGQAPAPPSFASGLFADLLVSMGPKLERLALRDLQSFGGVRCPSSSFILPSH